MQTRRGFTLIELMLVIAVAGVVLTLAAPSLYDFMLVQRLRSITSQLVTDIALARSEAASRGLAVTVLVRAATSAQPVSCYILFTDRQTGTPPPSNRCDCHLPAGSRCTSTEAQEIRTVEVPSHLVVKLSVPDGQGNSFAFDPITTGIVLPVTETGVGPGQDFRIESAIDSNRRLRTTVGVTGRVSVCSPTGSTVRETPCPSS